MKCALALILVGLAGCGGSDDGSCMPMQMPGDLAQRAALLRLDVFDGAVHCDGASVIAGAGTPTMSKVSPAGQPIHLDIPEGAHTLLLTAYSDEAGSELIATACTETTLKAGASVCFNLALVDPPDMAVERTTCNTNPDDCPQGQFCAVDGKCAPGCKTATDCTMSPDSLCKTDEHRCVECLVPSDCAAGKRCSPSGSCVDGCDVAAGSLCPGAIACCSNLCIDTQTELSSCGDCGRACVSTHVAAPACTGGNCTPTCATGFGDCNHPI